MLEKILRKIASRGQPVTSFDNDMPLSSGLSRSSISSKIGYPLQFVSSLTRVSRASTASWDAAKAQYCATAKQRDDLTQLPSAMYSWGSLHEAVAALLWINRQALGKKPVHITHNNELLALVDATERAVTVKVNALAVPVEKLSWQEKHSAARNHSGLKGEGFVTIPIYHLLWFYGQRVTDAVSDLPSNFGSAVLQLRRLPLIDPSLLHIRHLALMHRFSGGSARFSTLYDGMTGDEQLCLCADLASMYFTGSLKQMD